MERLTRAKAIKAKCLDCSGGDRSNLKYCPIKSCPLWIYRLGGEVTPEGVKIAKKRTPRKENDT